MKKYCIFDLDGTLIDSIGDIAAAVNASLKKMGFPQHSEDAYKKMVGNGMRRLCAAALPEPLKERTDELVALYNEEYLRSCCVHTKIYPGIYDMLLKLKKSGIVCGILSNKPHEQAKRIVMSLFPEDMFEAVQGQIEGIPCKPEPDALLKMLNDFSIKANDVVYIGDSDVDIILGQNAGVDTIGVSWGFRGREELICAGAECVAENADELLSLIEEM